LKKIILSLFVVGVVSVVALVATSAFFNDTETSTGNVLQAGALDLKIDNTCYYNGQACLPVGTEGISTWGGTEEGEQCSCTWKSKDLGAGDVFFNLTDLKPGDWEEDTISVEVDNPSWLCADITVTKDDDNTCTEPENAAIGGENGACAPGQPGELAQNLYIVFWKDDGDNVFETSEANSILTEGTADAVLGNVKWALADSTTQGGPIPAKTTTYIGKFFCFGNVEQDPLPQDGVGTGTPLTRDGTGFDCDGSLVDNKPQTDSLEGDISFYAEQARHNDGFLCNPPGD